MRILILVLQALALNLILLASAWAAEKPIDLVNEVHRLNRLSLADKSYDQGFYRAISKLAEQIGAEETLEVVRAANRGLGLRQRWQLLKRAQRFKVKAAATPKGRGNKLKVIYINGTNTTETYALLTLQRIKELLAPELRATYATVEFENFYNFSFSEYILSQVGLVLDLQEAVYQSLLLNTRFPYQGFMGLYSRDLRRMGQQFRASVDEGWDVLLVTHSQGGLFANQLQRMNPRTPGCQVMNLQLATPSTFYGFPLSDHLTNHDDIILKVPFSLPGNVAGARDVVPSGSKDRIYHSVMSIYLSSRLPVYPEAFQAKTRDLLERQQRCADIYASQSARP